MTMREAVDLVRLAGLGPTVRLFLPPAAETKAKAKAKVGYDIYDFLAGSAG